MVELKRQKQSKFWTHPPNLKQNFFFLFFFSAINNVVIWWGRRRSFFFKKIPPSLLRQATYEKTNALCDFEMAFCTSWFCL
jgi:hypothetical protein